MRLAIALIFASLVCFIIAGVLYEERQSDAMYTVLSERAQ